MIKLLHCKYNLTDSELAVIFSELFFKGLSSLFFQLKEAHDV